ncbi:MAG TPA: phenylalanine--tRNA ligase subunit beta [Acidimicrobiales bacterium]|nr:phenylalanine--tRNA ligase subunit beta [Acidimicrobiales bacterium]
MRVPLSWLRDFAPFEGDPVALGETFDDLGMVVESLERVGEGLGGVVVARVLDVRAHPKADRVRLTEVDAGDGVSRQVVCGAPNVAAGQLVALATIGAVLPGGFEISRRQVRGEWSEGMICSTRELALGDDAEGIMVLPAGLDPGVPFAEAMGIGADVVYDLAIEANRPDALSIAGVARDAAARLDLPFAVPEHPVVAGTHPVQDLATIAVECPDLCPRFTARVSTGVQVGESPAWLVRRLALAGMRAISDVVDASNYVMLELGQPTHPYDLDLLPGAGLLVRRAEPGETLVTLDGVTRRLGDGDDCLICDAEGAPVGIGGIMGGASSEISPSTTRVLLEAAYFDPMTIARTSKRLGLRTEASARFERGCDPEGIQRAVDRFFSLLSEGEVAAGMLDQWRGSPRPARIRLRTQRVNALLGTSIADGEIAALLEPIGFTASPAGAGLHDVTVPSFRPDVEAEIDLVEEVARHHGYSRIPPTVPASPFVGQLTPFQRGRRHLREILAGAGASEAVTPPLLGPGDHERAGLRAEAISAVDPLAREESILRTSLLPGLLKAVAFNVSRRSPDVALFEIGHVFRPPLGRRGVLPDEPEMLVVALADPAVGPGCGAVAAKRLLDLVLDAMHLPGARLDAATAPGLHPSRTARIRLRGDVVGHVGEVDPSVLEGMGIAGRVGVIEVLVEGLIPRQRSYVQARPVSRHPSSDIDLAFVVPDSAPAAAVAVTLREAAGELLADLRLFDVFRDDRLGAGRRSLAFRLRLQALDRTLTDAEVAELRRRCIAAVESAHGAEIRA